MGVRKMKTAHGITWAVDEWIRMRDGTQRRFQKRGIPTKELAQALVAKMKAEAFEGRWFERPKPSPTVAELWREWGGPNLSDQNGAQLRWSLRG